MLLSVIVAIVTKKRVSSRLKFKQFCVHDFERNINDKNLKQLFVYYQRQCLGSEPKLFHNNAKSTSEIKNYILEC